MQKKRKFFIMTASIGEGHSQAARAIAETIKQVHPDDAVRVLDFLSRDVLSIDHVLKESYLKYLGKGLDDALSRYDFGQVNTNRFSAFGTDFFSKQIGKYYISVCKRKIQSKDIQIIKM